MRTCIAITNASVVNSQAAATMPKLRGTLKASASHWKPYDNPTDDGRFAGKLSVYMNFNDMAKIIVYYTVKFKHST